MIGGLVLAAGEGARFGGAKQLSEIQGETLLQRAVVAMAGVPKVERTVVVLGARSKEILAKSDLSAVEVVVAVDWSAGLSSSLKRGIAELLGCEAVVITLADQPLIGSQAIARVLKAVEEPCAAARATYDGAPGHPVLIKQELFAQVAAIRGDHGAAPMLERAGALKIECGDVASPRDVDTDADLEAIRQLVRDRRAGQEPAG